MRNSLIASSVAALALVGLAGGAAFAGGSEPAPGATPTTLGPGMDIFADMGLTPEQGDCLVANAGTIDMEDLTALMDLMTQCGITMDQLIDIGQSAVSTTVAGETPTTTVGSTPAALDAATVAAVFTLMGLDQTAIDCLVTEAATAAPTDDFTAEPLFVTCGVGPLQILEGIVALDAQGGGATPDAPTTVALASATTVASSGSPMVDLLLEQLAAQGITLDAAQGQCILDNISDFDPNDMASVVAVLETCGIDIADLVPGG